MFKNMHVSSNAEYQAQQFSHGPSLSPKHRCLIALVLFIVFGSGWRLAVMLGEMGNPWFFGIILSGALGLFGFLIGMLYEGLEYPQFLKYFVITLCGFFIVLYLLAIVPMSTKYQTVMQGRSNIISVDDFGKTVNPVALQNQSNEIVKISDIKSFADFLSFLAQPFVGAILFAFIEMFSVAACHFIWDDLELAGQRAFLRGTVQKLKKKIKDIDNALNLDRDQIRSKATNHVEQTIKKPLLTKQDIENDPLIQSIDADLLETSAQISEATKAMKTLAEVSPKDKLVAQKIESALGKLNTIKMDITSPEWLEAVKDNDFNKMRAFTLDCFLKS